ncbi:MAG: hypothetical protein IKA32_05055 [Lentisphaeria bacterium]|nr:hypothetical protein [Lentisphaeria bacterium]
MKDKYTIRRALVKALARYFCPQELNTILCDDNIILLQADPSILLKEWDNLTSAEFILQVPGYPDYRSLNPVLRQKIENGLSLMNDPFFAGPFAVR